MAAAYAAPDRQTGPNVKILLVHNYYRSGIPSGENTVFEAEARLLESGGHTLERYTCSNDEIASRPLRTALTAALLTTANPFQAAALRARIAAFRPDVVHFHNTFPLLSPALLPAARASGCAVVATLHNYRLICAQGGLFRDGRICLDCLEQRSPWPGLRHACYRGSHPATLPVARMISTHLRRQTWAEAADALIVLTDFQKGLMQRAGIPAERLQVKPNFAEAAAGLPWAEREDMAIYLGRICEEKGIWTLLQAWERLGAAAPRLRIIGGGEALPELQRRIAASGLSARVEAAGALPHAQAMQQLARARLLVYPSTWYEPFGMSIVEAYARGVPVLASRLGSLPDLVRAGVSGELFDAGDDAALAETVRALWQQPGRLQALAAGSLRCWQSDYGAQGNLARLETIYRLAIERRRKDRRP